VHAIATARLRDMSRAFMQVDVFTTEPYRGNPVAVVLDAEGLTTEQMQRFANWTNLSETTFVTGSEVADYKVRIFTTEQELPFAGHPTLGTCHAWLGDSDQEVIVQECGAGLIEIRRMDGHLAFAAPPLIRSGPVDEPDIQHAADVLNITREEILDATWADNGPGWMAVLLEDADAVLALKPGFVDFDLGVVGRSGTGWELRALFPHNGATIEDPVTGSLNASVAGWLLETGRATAPYVAHQGTAIGRAGRIHVSQDADGTVWVGGGTLTLISGEVTL
jgi:PhzF family phenazine biosynthesis protein